MSPPTAPPSHRAPHAPSEPYGIDWRALRTGSTVVDVGAGLGTACLTLSHAYPHLRFVVQGTAAQLADADAYCAASAGRVALQAHDMLAPQPRTPRPAALFVLAVFPTLSDASLHRALTHLRAAAASAAHLVLLLSTTEARTPRHVSALAKSAGWAIVTAGLEESHAHPVKAVFAAPV